MHAQKFCYVLYTTCITHLDKSTKLHYTEYVVLLTQLCMVVESPVTGDRGLPPSIPAALFCLVLSLYPMGREFAIVYGANPLCMGIFHAHFPIVWRYQKAFLMFHGQNFHVEP